MLWGVLFQGRRASATVRAFLRGKILFIWALIVPCDSFQFISVCVLTNALIVGLVAAKAFKVAPLFFAGSMIWAGVANNTGAPVGTEFFARIDAFLCFLVQQRGLWCAAAFIRNIDHFYGAQGFRLAQGDHLTDAHRLAGFASLAVDVHLAAVDHLAT